MNLDAQQLTRILRDAKNCTPADAASYNGELNDYLFNHYFTPFLRGEVPTVGDLDFSQFTLNDVQEFEDYLEHVSSSGTKLVCFCDAFDKAKPIVQMRRAFC